LADIGFVNAQLVEGDGLGRGQRKFGIGHGGAPR
jgi:hypothetical protein